jgi:signal transduction histidine kinase
VRIHDNGIGIDKDQQERVFGLFQQVNPAAGSTGIGLAVARKAAQRVGGFLEVDSTPGEGSTFVVNLKAAE